MSRDVQYSKYSEAQFISQTGTVPERWTALVRDLDR